MRNIVGGIYYMCMVPILPVIGVYPSMDVTHQLVDITIERIEWDGGREIER